MTGHSSVNETLCTIVFSFAVVINHWRVRFCEGLLSVALLLLEHQDSRLIILQSTARLFKSKALSKYLLDLLYPTCLRNITILHIPAGFYLWRDILSSIFHHGYRGLCSQTTVITRDTFHRNLIFMSLLHASLETMPLMYSCVLLCCQCNMGALQQCVQSNAERHPQQISDHKPDFLLRPSIKNKEQCVVGNGSGRRDKGWQLWKQMKTLSVSTLSPAVKSRHEHATALPL